MNGSDNCHVDGHDFVESRPISSSNWVLRSRDDSDYPVLSNLYLEDSYVLDVIERPGEVVFILEAALTPEYSRYRAPSPREQYCYIRGDLAFVKVRRVEWLERSF